MRYIKRQNDGSFYLAAHVMEETLMYEPSSASVEIVREILDIIRGGTALTGMVGIQFVPTPFMFNQSPDTCPHPGPLIRSPRMGEQAECSYCKMWLGWFCPKSPDQLCHYYTDIKNSKYTVELRDGTIHQFDRHPLENGDEEQHQTQESEDWCLFCGAPEERK